MCRSFFRAGGASASSATAVQHEHGSPCPVIRRWSTSLPVAVQLHSIIAHACLSRWEGEKAERQRRELPSSACASFPRRTCPEAPTTQLWSLSRVLACSLRSPMCGHDDVWRTGPLKAAQSSLGMVGGLLLPTKHDTQTHKPHSSKPDVSTHQQHTLADSLSRLTRPFMHCPASSFRPAST